MKFGFRHADKFVGLFVLIATLFVAASVVVTGVNKRWFARDYEYVTRFNSAEGLSVGMEVKLRGFEIGKVEKITLNDRNQVDMTLVIYDTYIHKAVAGSVIEFAANPLGGGKLNFYPGTSSEEMIPEFSFIPSNQTEQGKKMIAAGLVDRPKGEDPISAIMGNIEPILTDVDQLILTLTGILKQVDSALAGNQSGPVGGMLVNLEDATGEITNILPVVEGVMQEVQSMTVSLALLMKQLEDPTGLVPTLLDPSGSLDTILNDDNVLFDQLNAILTEIYTSLANLAVMTGDLKGLTPELNTLLDDASGAIREGEKVLEGLSNNPLLRKGISEEVDASYQHGTLRDEEF